MTVNSIQINTQIQTHRLTYAIRTEFERGPDRHTAVQLLAYAHARKKMPKIDTLDALEEHEEHDDDYQTITNRNAN